MTDVTVLDGFKHDLAALPLPVRERAILVLVELRDGLRHGQPLENVNSVRDLADCFKVYFDTDPRAKPRYRLVYRRIEHRLVGVTLEAVAVGRRQNLDAYVRAVRNLGRTTDQ